MLQKDSAQGEKLCEPANIVEQGKSVISQRFLISRRRRAPEVFVGGVISFSDSGETP